MVVAFIGCMWLGWVMVFLLVISLLQLLFTVFFLAVVKCCNLYDLMKWSQLFIMLKSFFKRPIWNQICIFFAFIVYCFLMMKLNLLLVSKNNDDFSDALFNFMTKGNSFISFTGAGIVALTVLQLLISKTRR